MENIVVLNEEQFEDIIYRTVSRCLNEKNIGNFGEKPEDEGFYTRDELCDLLHIAYPTLWRIEDARTYTQSRKSTYLSSLGSWQSMVTDSKCVRLWVSMTT